jgi:predicted SnoaL-like aldol condensation-catalyzing enzyme
VSLEPNKAVARQYLEMWASGDVSRLGEIVAGDYVGHVIGGSRGRDDLLDRITTFRTVMSDPTVVINSLIAEGDLVAARLTVSGIHQETEQPTRLMGLRLLRVAGGQVREEWSAWETMDP